MKFTLFVAILFSIGWMSAVVKVHDGPSPDCCLSVSDTKTPVHNIKSYSMQAAPPCPIRAIRFYTMKDKTICSDPNDSWTKKAINHVDKMNSRKHPKEPTTCYTSATNLIPTTTSTIKTPGTETETSTSTPVTPIVTTIKTSGDGHPVDCCNTVTNSRISVEDILYYDMQNTNLCPGRAVRFYTKKNITICSDPDSIWAKKAKAIVDGRTTIKTSGPETEKNKTSIQPTSVSKDNPESSQSTATTFTSSATKDCCLAVTKNKPTFREVVDYKVQETPLCSVRAVLFITVGNKKICSSPVEDWVQDYIQNLNRRRKTIDERDKNAMIRIKDSNTNNYFCLKKEQSKYFCVKQP
uniref:Chemokine interleukin-8-like domain-containing protein n=1 Tax=Cyprinus carpio carpio TaxID=630221 RepID=A0A8C1EVF0_CYPCA